MSLAYIVTNLIWMLSAITVLYNAPYVFDLATHMPSVRLRHQ